jgi:hypothetical protein
LKILSSVNTTKQKIGITNKKHGTLFSRAAKNLGVNYQQKQLYFALPHSQKFWNLPAKTARVDCMLFSRAAKILES